MREAHTVILQSWLASELLKPCTLCILMRKKMCHHSELAGGSLPLLELVPQHHPTRENGSPLVTFSSCQFRHWALVPEQINNRYWGTAAFVNCTYMGLNHSLLYPLKNCFTSLSASFHFCSGDNIYFIMLRKLMRYSITEYVAQCLALKRQ